MNFLSLYKRQLIFFFKKKINIDLHNNEKNLSLENLFIKYGSDKAKGLYNNKSIGHGYTKFYLKNLEKLKYKKLNILEIGSYAGASAAAFSKFFPKSKIFCLDINISNSKYVSKNINVFGIDVTKEKSCRSFIRKANISSKDKYFDIIIDDGSHFPKHVIKTFNLLFLSLKSNGIYFVEDTHTSYNHYFGGNAFDLKFSNTHVNYFKSLTDSLNYQEIANPFYRKKKYDGLIKNISFYHNMIVLKKGINKIKSKLVINNSYEDKRYHSRLKTKGNKKRYFLKYLIIFKTYTFLLFIFYSFKKFLLLRY